MLVFHGADYQDSKKNVLFNNFIVFRLLMSQLDHNKISNSQVTLSLIIKNKSPTTIYMKALRIFFRLFIYEMTKSLDIAPLLMK